MFCHKCEGWQIPAANWCAVVLSGRGGGGCGVRRVPPGPSQVHRGARYLPLVPAGCVFLPLCRLGCYAHPPYRSAYHLQCHTKKHKLNASSKFNKCFHCAMGIRHRDWIPLSRDGEYARLVCLTPDFVIVYASNKPGRPYRCGPMMPRYWILVGGMPLQMS